MKVSRLEVNANVTGFSVFFMRNSMNNLLETIKDLLTFSVVSMKKFTEKTIFFLLF
jgi:hypothetical protein